MNPKEPDYSIEQEDAIQLCTDTTLPVVSVTGAAGTGKTTVLRTVYDKLSTSNSVVLCAPTGRAAKRITELTGKPAMTIHKLLEFPRPDEDDPAPLHIPRRNSHRPIDQNVVIVDEASMLGTELNKQLIDAIPRRGRIRYFGDNNQLPPVEPSRDPPFVRALRTQPSAELTYNFRSGDEIISNASCTTNCLAPLAKVLHEGIGIEHGLMTTIHAYTNDQVLTDVYHKDLRRARSATMSQIPTKTGAAAAVGLVLPELNGRLDGFSMRVPTINVSVVDLNFVASRATTIEEVNAIVKAATRGNMRGIMQYNDEPLVSVDFNHNPHSSIFDAGLTRVMEGTLVKVLSWYDNEWGFSNRMLDTTIALVNA